MGGTGVIDRFLEVFTSYIDSGFGLLGGEVAFLATTLIVIDVTLAALFWAWGAEDDILARLIKKTLFVGAFAYIISNWNALARIIFESFAGLGLQASGTGFSATDLMRPGRVAQVGLDAGRPILASISDLMGYVSFFENFIQIIVLMFAWTMVLLAFFILSVQLFITLIEFKLTTLAGFVLIPFGLFGKTAFLAERVLGNVVSSGVKVLVLAVIIGIGSSLFGEFTAGFGGDQPNIDEAMAIVLAALSLLGLGIFGPGIANGLISGGPQLSMGAAVGTGLVTGGVTAVGMAGTGMAAGAAGRGVFAGARGGAATVGGASAAYSLGSAGRTGAAGVASGVSGIARAGAGVATSPLRRAASALNDSAQGGARAAVATSGGAITGGGSPGAPTSSSSPPAWAARMGRAQTLHHGATAATHALAEEEAARTSEVFFPTQSPTVPSSFAAPSVAPPGSFPAPQPGGATQPDEDRQIAFLNAPVDRRIVAPDRVTPPASPYVLQAGSVIPAALVTGIRSDLPGQIVAQVTQNVYDSPSGRYLLLPQGSRLIGEYDNGVGFGQRRILLVWTRIILPDGHSIVLERQPGADSAGYAGLADDVDHHWGGLLRAAVLSTLLNIGAELGADNDDPIASAIRDGAQDTVGDAGREIVRRQIDIPPTLTIRPGFPVRVIVTRDLILEPQGGH